MIRSQFLRRRRRRKKEGDRQSRGDLDGRE